MRSHRETEKQVATKGIRPRRSEPSDGGFIAPPLQRSGDCIRSGTQINLFLAWLLEPIFRSALNLAPILLHVLPAGRRHYVIRAIVHDKLPVMFRTVLDGEHPDIGVVGQPVAEF